MKTVYKKSLLVLLFAPVLMLGLNACEDDDDGNLPGNSNSEVKRYSASINMKQLANGNTVSLRSDAVKPYTNKKGQDFNISRLRYLISDIQFNKADGSSFTIEEYHLVDLADNSTLRFTPATKVPAGNYSSISFTFGFDSTDNQTGIYADLNTANWNWPSMLGNGYHFMQLEGKYDSLGNDRFFATHMGKARNQTSTPVSFENNHFIAQPDSSAISVSGDFEFDIIMNVEQWYENPYEWDFTVWNAPIMPIYEAQKRLNENGPSVFSVDVP